MRRSREEEKEEGSGKQGAGRRERRSEKGEGRRE